MIKIRIVFLFFLLSAIMGCSSTVTRPDDADTNRPVVKALHGFTIDMSPEAKQSLPDNIQFDINALRATLQSELEENELMSPDGDFSIKVVVNDIRVRSSFNAVMWGFMAGDDHVQGDVVVFKTGESFPVYSYTIIASYALGGFAGGDDTTRMEWLYEEFSEILVNELIRKKEESNQANDQVE
jgi:hypothetical protein